MCGGFCSENICLLRMYILYHIRWYSTLNVMYFGRVCSAKVCSVIMYIEYYIMSYTSSREIFFGGLCQVNAFLVIMYILYHCILYTTLPDMVQDVSYDWTWFDWHTSSQNIIWKLVFTWHDTGCTLWLKKSSTNTLHHSTYKIM